jgi:hypothetical protein
MDFSLGKDAYLEKKKMFVNEKERRRTLLLFENYALSLYF